MKIPNFLFANLSLTLLAFSSLIVLFGSTLAAPRPLTPSNLNPFPRPGVNPRPQCRKPCDNSDVIPDVSFYKDAPEKQRKVEDQMKRSPDADPSDLPQGCAGERCDADREQCVQMSGHESSQNNDRWRTCCPKEMPFAGRKGKCCHKVGLDGVCIE